MTGGLDRTRLLAARYRAAQDRPYLATALFSITVVESPQVETMGVDRRWRCYVSPAFVARTPVPELAAVWIHEVAHLLRDHHGRADRLPPGAEPDHYRVNVAQDCEINDDLIADRLPLQDFLGFANQAVILCAVAREHGVTDRRQQVRLLASVMCDRNVGRDDEVASPAEEESAPIEWSFAGIGRALWQLAGLMRAIGNELVKRQRPKGIYRYLGMLPAAGAVADFLGEFGALNRAAKEGRAWIDAHQAVTA